MKTLESFLSELRQQEVTLWLEGDRLRYRAPEGSLSPEMLAELRDRKAEVIAFLQAAKQLSSTHQPPLQPIPRTGNLPLSFAQQRFWFLYQFEPDSPANNMPVVIRFTGNLSLDLLKRSIAEVVQRHEVLRSRFPMVDGQPVLAIDSAVEVNLRIIDLQGTPDAQRAAEAHQLITKDARQPFDLETDPLLRVTFFRLTEQEHLLLWNMPCMVCDGTSSDLFYRELTTCYAAYATGKSLDLPELPIQYADFASWQRQYLQGEVLESHLNYWQQQLNDDLTSLQLPTDYPRPAGLRTCQGDRYARMLPKSLHQDLLNLSQQLGTTLFVVLLTCFSALLYRYSQQDDVLTTFVSSGRNRVETENLIGFFSNTLILRTRLDRDLTFRELVQRIHRQNLDAYTHQELPFERLVDALSPEQRQGRSPLFQTKFTLNPPWTNGQGMAPIMLPDLKIESLFGYIYHGKTKYDLILVTREQDQGLGAVIDYNAELFTESTMERMMGHFQTLLENIVADPNQVVSTIPMLTAAEQQLLAEWSQAQKDYAAIFKPIDSPNSFSSDSEAAIAQLAANAQTYILDRYLQPVPIGVAGELYVEGSGLTREELNCLNLTEERSISYAFNHAPEVQLFKTGKMVRYGSDGMVERVDDPDQHQRLGFKEQISENGYVASRDSIEQQLTNLWEELLGSHPIGIEDNFFELGGHSLMAVRLFTQIETVLGKQLPLSILLQAPTIKELAAVLRQKEAISSSPLVKIQAGGSHKPPLFCIHGGGFNVLIYRDLALGLEPDQPVYGLQARGLVGDEAPDIPIRDRLEEIATDYVEQIQTIQPQGPYLLAGLSNGGNIALEMAQQLQAQGHQVSLVALFDCYGPGNPRLLPPCPRLLSSLKYALRYSAPRFIKKLRTKGVTVTLNRISDSVSPSQSYNQAELVGTTDEAATAIAPEKVNTSTPAPIPRVKTLEDRINWISQYILEHSPYAALTPSKQLQGMEGSTLSENLIQLEEIYNKAQKDYSHRPYSGHITLFHAMETPPGFYVAPQLGWDKIAIGGLEIYKIPGHHTSLMSSPILAKKMRDSLESIHVKHVKVESPNTVN